MNKNKGNNNSTLPGVILFNTQNNNTYTILFNLENKIITYMLLLLLFYI